jgi:hypothetical protein
MKLMRVIVFTDKMEKLTQFYGDQLGLKAKPDPNGDASEWIEFNGGGAGVALHKAHGGGGGGGTCAHKLVFYAKDVAKARAACEEESETRRGETLRQTCAVRWSRSGRKPHPDFQPEVAARFLRRSACAFGARGLTSQAIAR